MKMCVELEARGHSFQTCGRDRRGSRLTGHVSCGLWPSSVVNL